MPKRPFVRAVYETDPTGGDDATGYTGGQRYRVKLAEDIAALGELGFFADNPALPTLPRGLQMRYALFKEATGDRQRKLPVGRISAPAYATPGTTISMDQFNEAGNVTLVRTGRVGEQVTD